MSKRKQKYVISYDISSNKIRNKIASELTNYGRRVQYSVFECTLTTEKIRILYQKLLTLCCGEENDSIRIYLLCETCSSKIRTIGVKEDDDAQETVIII